MTRWIAAGCAAAALVLLGGCAPEPATPPQPAASAPPPSIPAPPPPTPAELRLAAATRIVDAWSTRERASGVLMGAFATTDPAAAAAFVQQLGLGGFIVMGPNVGDPAQLAALTAALSPDPALPLLIATDQEGGTVSRLPWDPSPGADALKYADPALTQQAFSDRSQLLAAAGVNVNFGIVADVSSDPAGFIFPRALGTDFAEASLRVHAAVAGEQGTTDNATAPPSGVAATLKHFPGHGAAPGDSHTGIPTTDLAIDAWRSSHALPFAAGVDTGAQLLMFGHLAFAAVDPAPATLSPAWHAIARDELGFSGVIVTDDLGMLLDSGVPAYADLPAVSVAALAAGADLALLVRGADPATLGAVIDAVTTATETGALPPERLREAAIRVVSLRLALAAPSP